MKHGYPSKNDSDSCQYSRLDFDCDEEYSQFFYKVVQIFISLLSHFIQKVMKFYNSTSI